MKFVENLPKHFHFGDWMGQPKRVDGLAAFQNINFNSFSMVRQCLKRALFKQSGNPVNDLKELEIARKTADRPKTSHGNTSKME